ncbi:rRNA maturation RNase YbeY [Sulfurospirillum arcachonense]|uniref:rRNA maturation RNase YbeY n=1 Tax=Sulfurospirillum arcachonense TaxID=57666 RepID=UPI000469F3B0|nr:rRNA maturation RNase YbeY [Sulfurospirillum arcachonense]
MITLDNQSDIKIDTTFLEKISDSLTQKEIELILIDSDTMQEINHDQRGFDKTTDVLSFPLEDVPYFPLGSILINSELAQIKADEFNHSVQDEITLLFIHGLLHLLGFDHEVDNGEMREKEETVIKEFSLPKSLIVRTV